MKLDPAQRLAALASGAGLVDHEADRQKARADDQRWLAKLIIGAFVFSVILLFSATFYLALAFPTSWKEPAQGLLAVVAQVLLPVVTLVVGYYFGTEKR